MQDPAGDLEDLVLVALKELVARIGLQDVAELLVAVAVGRLLGALDDTAHLPPDERHGRRERVIGRGGEEADEPGLAHDRAVEAEALHADVVHVHAPVHPRHHVRLGHDQRRRLAQELLHRRRDHHRLRAPAEHVTVGVPQHAAAGLDEDVGLVAHERAARVCGKLVDPAS